MGTSYKNMQNNLHNHSYLLQVIPKYAQENLPPKHSYILNLHLFAMKSLPSCEFICEADATRVNRTTAHGIYYTDM